MTHLTESQRQSAADGTLEARTAAAVESHLAECAECAVDVARLRALLVRARDTAATAGVAADEWPAIRARIERGKVVALPGARPARRWRAFALAAAILVIAALALMRSRPSTQMAGGAAPDSVVLAAASDSANAYREQIADLMSDLELRRGLLRTETSAAIDHDLKECDLAIAELDSAIKADPNNPALRQMLAASYRRKLDVLKRVGNAS